MLNSKGALIFYINKSSMFYSIEGFVHQIFVVLVVLLVSAIATGTCFSFGSRRASHATWGVFLILIVGVQLYYLIFAALHVPANQFYVFNVSPTLTSFLL